MANNEAPQSLPPPKLVVPRAEAAQKISVQIEKGQAIRGMTVGSDEDYDKLLSEFLRWETYNRALLSRLFDNRSIEYEFASHYFSSYVEIDDITIRAKSFRRNFDDFIFNLESILGTLDVIPEPTPEPVQASTSAATSAPQAPLSREIFIVHGHDDAAKESVARVLSQLDLKPIILNEKADAGLTIIEKFEKHANVAFAVILLTPDDIGCSKREPDQQKPRARQNVILEFGYFLGKLGRGKVCALYKEGVELPSDLYGILYVSMDAGGAWKYKLAQEINQAGIKVDSNALLAD